ncbi:MAG: alpha/beta fold hydrolase [Pirellulales bacterium]
MSSYTTDLIDVAGKKTQVLKGGDGPPLVYLHSAAGETMWTPVHRALAARYTLYAPAHPGFDQSEGLDRVEDIEDMVWHYVDLLHQLGLDRVPIVGFSLGGWIGVELAVRHPQRVSKLVLADAAGLHVDGAPMADLFVDDVQQLREMAFYDPAGTLAQYAMPEQMDEQQTLLMLRAREATARIAWNPYLHNPKLPAHLHRLACPVLILWGRDDKLIPLAHGQRYAELIPGATLQVFDQTGHMLPLERGEEFVRATLEFLAR